MEDSKKNCPSLPPNYVTIVDLQKRWAQQQQQKQQQQQQQQQQLEKEKNQKMKREKTEELNHNLRNKDNDRNNVKRSSKFQNLPRSKPNGNPNFATWRPSQGNWNGEKPLKAFRVVEELSDSRGEAPGISVDATRENSQFRKLNRLKCDGNSKLVSGRIVVGGRKPLKKVLEEEEVRSPMVEALGNCAAVTEIEIKGLKVGDEKKLRKKSNWRKTKNRVKERERQNGVTSSEANLDDQAAEVVEEKGQATLDDQTAEMAEIEVTLKEIVLSGRERKDERSAAANEGSKRVVQLGYGRVERREWEWGQKKWAVKTEKKNLVRDEVCVEEIDNQGEGGGNVGGHISGGWKSTITVDRSGRRENRWPRWGDRRGGYSGGEHWVMVKKRTECGGLMWVKKGEVSV